MVSLEWGTFWHCCVYEDMGVLYSYVVQFLNLRLTGGVVSDVMRLPLYYKIGVVKC